MDGSPKAAVLVTDGDQRAALAVVRSLGRAGYAVKVGSTTGCSLAGASRYASAELVLPDPLTAPGAYAAALSSAARAHDTDVLIPITEPALLAVLPRRDLFPGITVPFADAETFARISDKEEVLAAAASAGIAVPAQVTLPNARVARDYDPTTLRFPVVVKPARSVSGGPGTRVKLSVTHAGGPDALRRVLASLPDQAYPVLIQQRIVGPGIGIFLLVWDGRTIATFAHQRLREKPPAGGISVYRESVPLDEALVARSRTLLDAFGWRGVAMVEYKVDAAAGQPYLMEINGRFWGSLQLAIDAGVDFPTLLVRTALGECVAPVRTYDTSVRSRWWWGDVDHLLARLRRSPEELALPPGSPGRRKALRDFLRRDPRDRDEINQAGDRAPFRRESWQWLRAAVGRP